MKKLTALLLAAMLIVCGAAFAEEAAARTPAPYCYELSGTENYVENLIFNGDVIISGDDAQIVFANCQFNGDIINTADTFTRVMILPDCEVNGRLVLRNSVQEGTIDTALPKFLTFVPSEFVTEDCIGAVLTLGGFDIQLNGTTYTMADAQFFYDGANPDAGIVPYEGQDANVFLVGRWWENGEEVIFTYCEYDPTM